MTRWSAILATLVAMLAAAPSDAATPPSELMEARLKQARDARKPTNALVKVTVVGSGVVEYRGDARLVTNSSFKLASSDGKSLEIGGDAGPGAILGWILLSSSLVEEMSGRGDFRPKKTGVEVLAESFGYRYGDDPSLIVTRDLSRVLQIDWTSEKRRLSARLSYDGDTGWPSNVSVLRDGRPWLRMDIEPEKAK